MGFGQAEFPGNAGVLDGRLGRSTRAAVVARDEHHVGMGLGHTGSDGTDTHLGHQLDADAGVDVGVLEIVDQLGQILDGIDVVVRRRGNQTHTRGGVTGLGHPRIDLGARQLAALTGLGALGHLDLKLLGVDQVLAGHAKAPRRHLLDGGVLRIAVGQGSEALGVFATFTGVGLAAQPVHGDGQSLVGLLGNGTIAHRAGLEALHDGLDGLHFFDGDRVGRLEVEQTAQGGPVLELFVDRLGVILEGLVVARAHGLLQLVDRVGIEQVVLAIAAPLVAAADIEGRALRLAVGEGRAVPRFDVAGDFFHADTFDAGRRPGEVAVDDGLVDADGLEDLGAAVRLDRRDAHLGSHLDDALDGRFDEVLVGGLGVDVGEQTLMDHVVDRLEGQIRVDGAASVTDEQREVVDLARFAGLQDQSDPGAGTLADEVVMQTADGQQGRDGRALGAEAAVGENEDVGPVIDGLGGGLEEVFQSLLEALGALVDLVEDGQGDRLVARLVDALELGQFFIGQHRRLQLDEMAALRTRSQQVLLGADRGDGAGDDLFADAVDRRVGDLREQLVEVVVKQLRLVGEHRQRRVGAHRTDGFDTVAGHGDQQHAEVFERVSEGLLALEHRGVAGFGQVLGIRQ